MEIEVDVFPSNADKIFSSPEEKYKGLGETISENDFEGE